MAQISFRRARLPHRRMKNQFTPWAIADALLAINPLFFASAVAATLAGHQIQSGGTLLLSRLAKTWSTG